MAARKQKKAAAGSEEPLLAEILDGEHASEFVVPEPAVDRKTRVVVDLVRLANLGMTACNVPTASGLVRLGPKASEVISAADVTEEMRQAERNGRILIQHL